MSQAVDTQALVTQEIAEQWVLNDAEGSFRVKGG
jgi:hypothetical protein